MGNAEPMLDYAPEPDEIAAFSRKLGAAVILRAVADARSDRGDETTNARVFLLDEGSSLPFWCELAGLQERVIRAYAKKEWPNTEIGDADTTAAPAKARVDAPKAIKVRRFVRRDAGWPVLVSRAERDPWLR